MQGYSTSRTLWNNGTRPLLQACADASAPCTGAISSFTMAATAGASGWYSGIVFDANSRTSSTGYVINAQSSGIYNVKIQNTTAFGMDFQSSSNGPDYAISVEVSGCSGTAGARQQTTSSLFYGVTVHGCTVTGITNGNSSFGICAFCISYSNTGASSDGLNLSINSNGIVINSIFYANGRYGINLGGSSPQSLSKIINTIVEANTNLGFNGATSEQPMLTLLNCAAYNNNGGTTIQKQYSPLQFPNVLGFINNTTGSFFVNAAGGDFRLNDLVNQGALARNAGIPSTFPGLTSVQNYMDIGAYQHFGIPRNRPAGNGR